jgi:hypothetical protein
VISQVSDRAHETHGAASITVTITFIRLGITRSHLQNNFSPHLTHIPICIRAIRFHIHIRIRSHKSIHTFSHILCHSFNQLFIYFKLFNIPVVYHLPNRKLQKHFRLLCDFQQKLKSKYLSHNVRAAATCHTFIIPIEVGGPRAPEEGLGGESELGGRVGIVDADVHIS